MAGRFICLFATTAGPKRQIDWIDRFGAGLVQISHLQMAPNFIVAVRAGGRAGGRERSRRAQPLRDSNGFQARNSKRRARPEVGHCLRFSARLLLSCIFSLITGLICLSPPPNRLD